MLWARGSSADFVPLSLAQMAAYQRDYATVDAVHEQMLNDPSFRTMQRAFNQNGPGATGGGDNPNTLFSGNGTGGPPIIIPVGIPLSNNNGSGGGSGGNSGGPLIIIPPPLPPSTTFSSTTATENDPITVTVTQNGSNGVSATGYLWQVSADNGTTFSLASGPGANTAAYIPTEADEGKILQVVITLSDGTTTTQSFGIVQEDPSETALVTLTGNTDEGQTVTATVNEPDAPATGILYTFQTSSDGVNWTTVQSLTDVNTYKIAETD